MKTYRETRQTKGIDIAKLYKDLAEIRQRESVRGLVTASITRTGNE